MEVDRAPRSQRAAVAVKFKVGSVATFGPAMVTARNQFTGQTPAQAGEALLPSAACGLGFVALTGCSASPCFCRSSAGQHRVRFLRQAGLRRRLRTVGGQDVPDAGADRVSTPTRRGVRCDTSGPALGAHVLARTDAGWSHLDAATLRPLRPPTGDQVRTIVADAISGTPSALRQRQSVSGSSADTTPARA